jgi:kynurenine formamidase
MTEELTADWVRREGGRLRRWGRWGDDDGKGALNLITEDRVRRAAETVRRGRVFSLAMPFGQGGPSADADTLPDKLAGRYNPKLLMVEVGDQAQLPGGFQYADDVVFMSLQSATQWDALSHAFYDGVMWNGRPVKGTITDEGTSANSVTAFRDGVVGRGVLVDVARHRGVDCLDDNEAIGPEELDAVVAAQGVEIEPGDIVVVRTGRVGRAIREGAFPFESFTMASPGLSARCAEWLVVREVAAVAADNIAVETTAAEVPGTMMPLHMICQRDAGIPFGELFDLEALAAACAEERRWVFLLVAAPLAVRGAVGGPVNPIAIL